MFHFKRLALLPLVFCTSVILIGCGMANGKPGRSSTEMDDVREVQIDQQASFLAFAPDGKTLAVSHFGTIGLWDAVTGEKICESDKTETEGGCCSIAFSPDGTMLASIHAIHEETSRPLKLLVYLWKITSEKQLANLRAIFTEEFHADACGSRFHFRYYQGSFSADGSALTVATPDAIVHVWETATGKERVNFPGGVAANFAEDGKTLITVTQGGIIRRWKTEAGNVVRVDQCADPDGYIYVRQVAFDPTTARVAISDGYAICIKDTQTGRTLGRVESKWMTSLAFTADGSLKVADDKGYQIVDSNSGEAHRYPWVHGRFDRAFAFSPDGKRLALSDDESILIQSWATVAAQADKDNVPTIAGGAETALKAELVANTDTYDLDLGGKTAEKFSSLAWPDRPPPAVDLSLRIRNTGSEPVSVRVWDDGKEVRADYILGDGAFNYPRVVQTGLFGAPKREIIHLSPGESISLPVKEFDDIYNTPYWLVPGEYAIHASASFDVSPPPPGVMANEDGFGFVHLDAAPAKVKVR
jgi:WD40 repeat protein